jgi:hypothetical protein
VIHNVHERTLPADPKVVGRLLDRIAEPGNPLWPARWHPLVLQGPIAPGVRGGHGPINYEVTEHVPGVRLAFRFRRTFGLDPNGHHCFEVLPDREPDRSRLRHTLTADPPLPLRAIWACTIGPLHDALLEDLLDNAAAETGAPRTATWSPIVVVLRAALTPLRARPRHPDPRP